jgi:uncharacterized protein
MADAPQEQHYPPLTSLSAVQRRVLGVMIEKALTVPDSYPLTLNSLITGCNQKNNRHPVSNYDDGDVQDAIEELRKIGLAAVVYPDSGRTERYRHYFRKRFSNLSEPQVAIMAELLLRGRQTVGDLRARAARMAPPGSLDTQDQLRNELNGLMEIKFIQADGPLDRRGVEVDHKLYEPKEGRAAMVQREHSDEPVAAPARVETASAPMTSPRPESGLEGRVKALETRVGELNSALTDVRAEMSRLTGVLEDLKRAYGL